MQRKSSLKISIVMSFFLLLFVANSPDRQLGELSHKIAFLKKGEVWVSDLGGQKMKQITSDSGKIDDFQFSPSLKYLAYGRIIRFEDEPGLWDDTDKVPQCAVCSIKIMNLETGNVIKEITLKEDRWIYISKWLPGNKLYYYGSSGLDVSGFYTYDIQKDLMEEIDYEKSSSILGAEYCADGSLKTYVDDSGVGKEFRMNLHLVDVKTHADRILVSKRSIADHRLANDLNRVAFVEVEDVEKKYYDNLWVYDIKGNSLRCFYRGPANAKSGGVNGLSWSFDDRFIGMFFQPNATVIEVKHPDSCWRIQGSDFSWIDNGRIVFAKVDDTYLYSLETRTSDLLIEGASKPAFLWKKDY
jgi:Tol biopolymer transport system component